MRHAPASPSVLAGPGGRGRLFAGPASRKYGLLGHRGDIIFGGRTAVDGEACSAAPGRRTPERGPTFPIDLPRGALSPALFRRKKVVMPIPSTHVSLLCELREGGRRDEAWAVFEAR